MMVLFYQVKAWISGHQDTIDEGIARSSQLGRPGLTLSTMLSDMWVADKF